MRNRFPGYYRPTDDEFQQLWDHAFIVVDANVLLDLYRKSRVTRDEYLDILTQLKDRLWIPYQVAHEYQDNRITSIASRLRAINDSDALIQEVRKDLVSQLLELPEETTRALESLKTTVDQLRDDSGFGSGDDRFSADPIRDSITALFDGAVGGPYDSTRLESIFREGKVRYADSVPPGYKDAGKGGTKQYGDLILWNQLLDEAKRRQQPVIFVTKEQKDDWWWRHDSSFTIGPRHELIAEFLAFVGKPFYMYKSGQFLQAAGNHLKQNVSAAVIDEIGKDAPVEETTATLIRRLSSLPAGFSSWEQLAAEAGGLDLGQAATLATLGFHDTITATVQGIYDEQSQILADIRAQQQQLLAPAIAGITAFMNTMTRTIPVVSASELAAQGYPVSSRRSVKTPESPTDHETEKGSDAETVDEADEESSSGSPD